MRGLIVTTIFRGALCALTLAWLAACSATDAASPPASGSSPHPADSPPALASAQVAVAETVMPAVVAIREAIAPLAPDIPPPPPDLVDPDAVALIVRFEILSPAYYERRLQGVICPGGASGPTWGVGYDGGHQTRAQIASDWLSHAAVERLTETSGAMGPARCRASADTLADVRTGLDTAHVVFRDSTLPRYHYLASRTFRNGWSLLPPRAQGALTSVVFNRGASMTGEKRRDMRTLRDRCVPAGDVQCIADTIRDMVWVWEGTTIEAGMRNRRFAEADLALGRG